MTSASARRFRRTAPLMFAVLGLACASSTTTAPDTERLALTPSSSTARAAAEPRHSGPEPTDSGFAAPPILGRPTNNSIVVNSLPETGGTLTIEFGTDGVLDRRTAPQVLTAGVAVETVLDGLTAGTTYAYRVVRDDLPGATRSFVTQRPPGSTFTFTVQGDSHPERTGKQFSEDLYVRTLRATASSTPDFAFAMGDDFSVDTLKTVTEATVREVYLRQRPWLGLVGSPWFLVNGNHEQASRANLDGSASNVAVWAQTARNSLYPQPGPDDFYSGDAEIVPHIGLLRDYFAFTWGDALFVVLDPYWHSPKAVDNAFGATRETKAKRDVWDNTLGETQYRWFERTLSTTSAEHIFVFTHHVNGTGRGGAKVAGTFEWGDAAGYRTERPTWARTIHQLMVDHGVTMFLQGHDHVFAHEVVDGIVYQTLPDPGNPNPTSDNVGAYPTAVIHPNSGHLRVSVGPDNVVVEYVRSFVDRPDEVTYRYEVG